MPDSRYVKYHREYHNRDWEELENLISRKQRKQLREELCFSEVIEGTEVWFHVQWSEPVVIGSKYGQHLCGHSHTGSNPIDYYDPIDANNAVKQLVRILKLFRAMGLDAQALFPVGGKTRLVNVRGVKGKTRYDPYAEDRV